MSLETSILAQLNTIATAHPSLSRWVIAYSGGVDSTVLLDCVIKANSQLTKPLALVALHVNHQLSPNAQAWQDHCEQTALSLGAEFVCEQVAVVSEGQGLEAAARESRYQVFESFMLASDCLLLGHHLNDQSETVMLRLMRGAGVLGLSGIPLKRPLGHAMLVRPLLEHSQSDILQYAQANNLAWVEDESNDEDAFDRNYLRNQIMPLLSERWPQFDKQLARTASHLSETETLLTEFAEMDLAAVDHQVERYGVSIDWKKVKQFKPERISNLIRFWCKQQELSLPSSEQIKQIHEQFFKSNSMLTGAIVTWSDGKDSPIELRQFNQRLYLMRSLPVFEQTQDATAWDVNTHSSIALGASGKLRFTLESDESEATLEEDQKGNNKGLSVPTSMLAQQISIQWRRGGERCQPVNRSSSQTLKKLLQEYQLETWLRDRVPLLYVGDQLAAVGDLWLCKEFAPKNGEPTQLLKWVLS